LNMSKQEIEREEFYEKYKDVNFKFLSYYKFTFTYRGFTSDGEEVKIGVGGVADDIYRESVSADDVYSILYLMPYQGESASVAFHESP
ncbi:TPA: hypothetical protein MPW60_003110, partial [Listeria monocytogenes]|nr:hypothetical protein [Listeria monocytogenes]